VNNPDDIAWHPGFNDPDLMSWVTFTAYGISSVLCFRAAMRRDSAARDPQARRAWFLFGLALAFLGLNLQLDLHALLFQLARRMAESQGWYEKRRPLQFAFIAVFSAGMIAGMIFAARRFGNFVRTQKLAVIGALLIIGYVLARNATFNHIDERVGVTRDLKARLVLVELAGVIMIGVAAWRSSRAGKLR